MTHHLGTWATPLAVAVAVTAHRHSISVTHPGFCRAIGRFLLCLV
jgi:hypothetical protein